MSCNHSTIAGATSAKRRHVIKSRLNDPNDDTEVGILSMSAAGVGGNYGSGCNAAYFCDLPWSQSLWRQCIGRVHRIGQVHEVRVYNLVFRGTLDEALIRIHENKADRVNTVIDNGTAETLVFDTESSLRAMGFGIDLPSARLLKVGPGPQEQFEAYVERAAVVLPRFTVDHLPRPSAAATSSRGFVDAQPEDAEDTDWYVLTDLASEMVAALQREKDVQRRAEMMERANATVVHVYKRQ